VSFFVFWSHFEYTKQHTLLVFDIRMSVSSTNQSNPIHTKESSLEHIHKISTSLLHQSRISDEIDTACCESISKTQHVEKILDNLQAMQ